jgi:hypothetical protein
MVTMGARQSLGLFVGPLNTSTGAGHRPGHQLCDGGGAVRLGRHAAAGRRGGRPLGAAPGAAAGIVLLAMGSALTPFMGSRLGA